LIAGGLIFVSTYVPPADPCVALGNGYLYIFPYQCGPFFEEQFNPVNDSTVSWVFLSQGSGENEQHYGVRISLGRGMPSAPVLDSSGEHVIVQLSDADLLRIGVNLDFKKVQVRGWKEIVK
jgi:type IV pilus assembly protein PilY1